MHVAKSVQSLGSRERYPRYCSLGYRVRLGSERAAAAVTRMARMVMRDFGGSERWMGERMDILHSPED